MIFKTFVYLSFYSLSLARWFSLDQLENVVQRISPVHGRRHTLSLSDISRRKKFQKNFSRYYKNLLNEIRDRVKFLPPIIEFNYINNIVNLTPTLSGSEIFVIISDKDFLKIIFRLWTEFSFKEVKIKTISASDQNFDIAFLRNEFPKIFEDFFTMT